MKNNGCQQKIKPIKTGFIQTVNINTKKQKC